MAPSRQLITTPQQLGAILRARRRARHISQTALATSLGISQERLSRLEADPGGLTLERLLVAIRHLGLELVIEDRADEAPEGEW